MRKQEITFIWSCPYCFLIKLVFIFRLANTNIEEKILKQSPHIITNDAGQISYKEFAGMLEIPSSNEVLQQLFRLYDKVSLEINKTYSRTFQTGLLYILVYSCDNRKIMTFIICAFNIFILLIVCLPWFYVTILIVYHFAMEKPYYLIFSKRFSVNHFQCLVVPIELAVFLVVIFPVTSDKGWVGRGASMAGMCDCVKEHVGFIM